MPNDLTLQLLNEETEEEKKSNRFDPLALIQEDTDGTDDASLEEAGLSNDSTSFFEAFAERAGDNIITRPLTRPLRVAQEALQNQFGDTPVEERATGTDFFESTLPLEELPENSLAGAILGDIFGETVAGALFGQRLLAGVGPAGRTAGGILGGIGGAAVSTARGVRQSLAIQRARGASRTVMDEAIAQSQRPSLRTLGDDIFFDLQATAQHSPVKFISQELAPFVTAATVGAGFAEATSGDRDAEVSDTATGALLGAIFSPATLIGLSTPARSAVTSSFKNIKNFIFRGPGSPRDMQVRAKAAEKLTLIAEEQGISMPELLRTITDSMERVSSASPAVVRAREIAELGDTSLDNLLSMADDPAQLNELRRIAQKVDMVDDEGTPLVGQLQGILAQAKDFREAAQSLPVGNLTGNEFLVALQRRASAISPESSGQDQLNINTFMEGMLSMEEVLRASGDPQALAVAAQVRKESFDTLLDTRVEAARLRALNALDEVGVPAGVDASDVRRGASRRVHDNLSDALEEARNTESSLYAQFGDGVDISVDGAAPLREALENARTDLGDFYGDLPLVRRVERIAEEGGTVPQIAKIRSRLLDKERRLRSAGEFDEARDLRTHLIGPLKDLISIPELQIANDFSRALNDTFTRSVTRRFLGTDREGGLRVDPEAMLGELLRGGGDAATIRLDRILQSAEFGDRAAALRSRLDAAGRSRTARMEAIAQNDDLLQEISHEDLLTTIAGYDTEFGPAIMRETDLFVRALATEFRDADGQVDVNRFVNFVRNNNTVIDKFDDLKEELMDVRTASLRIRRVEQQNKLLNNATATRRLFGGLIGQDNPTPVVQRALRSPNRSKALRTMAVTARRAEEGIGDNPPIEGAMEGLRTSILDALYMNSKQGDNFRWDTYREALLAPSVGSKTSLMDDMIELGIMNTEQADRLTRMVDVGAQVHTALRNPADLDSTVFNVGKTNALKEGLIAVTGSSIFGGVAKKLKGALGLEQMAGDIVANQAGATAFRNFFIKRGEAEVLDMIMEATSNAQLFKALFEEFDATSLRGAADTWQTLKIALVSAEFKAIQETSLEEEYGDALDLPEIPEPLEGEEEPLPVDEPDFFEQLRGGQ